MQNNIKNLVEEFNFNGQKDFKLIVLFGLLGDFDSFEYAINLKSFTDNHQDKNLDIFAIAIGNKNGKEKFCNFTGFSAENLIVVSDNQIHNNLKVSRGLDIGLGGWVNMLLMLSGINSFKTIKEVIRGYVGDRKANQIYSEFDKIEVLRFLKISGNSFSKVFGYGYLRPFELATFRLNNMNEIIQNWSDYILNEEYLPQRGASFLLNNQNQVIYKFFSTDVLGYSSNMRDPLGFLSDLIKK
nr:AhpC/TSA family protein [Prochlorococcus marinus]